MFSFLKRNAEYFERKAREAFEEGVYGFAVFFAEQAFQLYIKYVLAKSFGDYPKTHRFSALFELLRNVAVNAKKFYEENVELFEILEDSYVGVRYLGRDYSRSTAEKVLGVLDKFKEAFKDVL